MKKKLLRDRPFPEPERAKRPTITGIPAPARLPADRCRCHIWPRHRLMADGHRPYCAARDQPDTAETEVVDDPDVLR